MNLGSKNTNSLPIQGLAIHSNQTFIAFPAVMGVLNITADSFYDGGRYSTEEQWINHTAQMLDEGADIIDLGAVSTRPGAEEVPEFIEIKKIKNAVHSLIQHFPNIVISVDTYRASVAQVALDEGASIINDISAGDFDAGMIPLVARWNVPYIMMHILGSPATMQINPRYDDVVMDIVNYFKRKIEICHQYDFDRLIIDPGFGFGKTLRHNYTLLSHLSSFVEFGYPVLVGVSRKSMIYKLLNIEPEEALYGTIVANTLALLNGANIIRVHDVKPAIQAIKIILEYKNASYSTHE
ncbi:MAG: Dihydropteroate synthase [Bacteroidetes bacterium 38_7]|nr:MAG: Dihydropteroate synthase [Bacteroidetes bacterium 38_7]